MERLFNLASGLTTLKHRLQVDNLDRIITMVKNWPDGPHLNCSQHKDLTDFLKVESILANDNYDLIKESNSFEKWELERD
jgi:hypothetical protein